MLFSGLASAVVVWIAGPLTIIPLLRDGRVAWTLGAVQQAFPGLVTLLWSGAAAGIIVALIRERGGWRPTRALAGTLVRGLINGSLAAPLLGRMLDSQATWLERAGMMDFLTDRISGPVSGAVGLAAGLAYALLHGRGSRYGTGPTVIRGTLYGFFWWVAGALTIMPLAAGQELPWTLGAARLRFPALPAFAFAGVVIAVLDGWLAAAGRLLFSDDVRSHDPEGIGAQGLRAIARGAFAGLIGGLVFTIVMLRIGVLPAVARLVGSESAAGGFIVHLIIANIVGASFGVLFLGRSYDLGSAMGWGLAYGSVWWLLGPMTLMPLLLGTRPVWTAEVAGMLIPSLVGHLAYGTAAGATFYLLESRLSPWWITHTEREAERAARRRTEVMSSAPALWALAAVMALTIPILLSCGTTQDLGGYSMSPSTPSYGYGGPEYPPSGDQDAAVLGLRDGCQEP
jgi:hypothetical protein